MLNPFYESASLKIAKFSRFLRRTSLRVRLMFAFLILILSSATATIFIGNAVFGSEIFELAKQKADVDLNVAWQIWNSKISDISHVLSTAASAFSYQSDKETPDDFDSKEGRQSEREKRLHSFWNETFFDFLGVTDEVGRTLIHAPQLPHKYKTSLPVVYEALYNNKKIASAVIVKIPHVIEEAPHKKEELLRFKDLGEVMLIAVAEPLMIEGGKKGVIYGGFIVNDKKELVKKMSEVATGSFKCAHPPCSAASIFQMERRVATSLTAGERGSPMLSAADSRVTQTTLKEGREYIGVASVVGMEFYAAYRPVKDYSGKIIGMLGIGATVAQYRMAQTKTTILFSSLIIGGMIFGFIMTYLFSALLVKPVAELAEGMSRVAEGDLNYKVRIESADELGRLAKAFNRMVRAVKERDNKLREMTESRLSEVEKQISIGRFAAGVAHEINNPLTAILSLSKLMLRHTPEYNKHREDLKIIIEETTRCREIVASLLDFARERPPTKRIIEINTIIKDTLALANKYDALQEVEISVNSRIEPLYVLGDSKQLQQVFTNIIINAAEAIKEAEKSFGKKREKINIIVDEDSSGEFVQVQIKDTGIGIPEEQKKKIFEPFFTTKGKSKGTGLGLSVSLGIINKHNGTIEVESKEGEGTVVTVTLPLQMRDAAHLFKPTFGDKRRDDK
ncbi:MAG: cache domain-containing protein [Myxococcota bacterium]